MSLDTIDLGLRELLSDPTRRREFFKSITRDEIASQIRELRKKRGLNQTAFAQQADMKQSAVSRIEQAEYSSWTLTTLFRVADALDARWRIILEPAEDAIRQFEIIDRPTEKFELSITVSPQNGDELAIGDGGPIPVRTSYDVLTARRAAKPLSLSPNVIEIE